MENRSSESNIRFRGPLGPASSLYLRPKPEPAETREEELEKLLMPKFNFRPGLVQETNLYQEPDIFLKSVGYLATTLRIIFGYTEVYNRSSEVDTDSLAVSGSRKDFCPLRCLPRKTPTPTAIATHFPLRRSPTNQNSVASTSIPLHRSTFPLPPILPTRESQTRPSCPNIFVKPVINVVSVVVCHHSFALDKKKSCEVYGTIYANDENGICQIYQRGWDEAETIDSMDNNLTLIDGALAMSEPKLYINLKEKGIDECVIVKGSFSLDTRFEDDKEELKCLTVEVDWGYINVYYVSICYGVVGEVELSLQHDGFSDNEHIETSDSDEDDETILGDIDIVGVICARYESICGPYFGFGEKALRTELFHQPPDQPQKIKFGSPIRLSRFRVAMPAYSSLIIEVNLMESGTNKQLAFGRAELKLRDYSMDSCLVCGGEDENVFVKVEPIFHRPFTLQELSLGEKKLVKVPTGLKCFSGGKFLVGSPLLEIFSIVIGRDYDLPVRLYGDINMYHNMGSCELFSREEENALDLPEGTKTLPLHSPLQVAGSRNFSMSLELKDSMGYVDISGSVSLRAHICRELSMFHRFMCSYVDGPKGYAAVHYMIFSEAVQANVRVALLCKTSDSIRISGRLVAWYGKIEYPTHFEKNYYRSVLFEMPEDVGFQVENVKGEGDCSLNCFELPLSKFVVPVPMDSSLVISVDLCSKTEHGREILADVVDLKIGTTSESSRRIVGMDLDVDISVKWS